MGRVKRENQMSVKVEKLESQIASMKTLEPITSTSAKSNGEALSPSIAFNSDAGTPLNNDMIDVPMNVSPYMMASMQQFMQMAPHHIQMMSVSTNSMQPIPIQPAVGSEGAMNVTPNGYDDDDVSVSVDEAAALYKKQASKTPGNNVYAVPGMDDINSVVMDELNRAETEKETAGNDDNAIRNQAGSVGSVPDLPAPQKSIEQLNQ